MANYPSLWGDALVPLMNPFMGGDQPFGFNWTTTGPPGSFSSQRPGISPANVAPPGVDPSSVTGVATTKPRNQLAGRDYSALMRFLDAGGSGSSNSGLMNAGVGLQPQLTRPVNGAAPAPRSIPSTADGMPVASPMMLGGPTPPASSGGAVARVEDNQPSQSGGVFQGLQSALLNPMALGGLSLLAGGDLNSGINAGLAFQKQREADQERQALAASIDNLPGLSQQDRRVLRSSPTLAQDVASKYYTNRFAPKGTDALTDYNFARSQGYTGSFLDYQLGLKRAASPNFNVTNDMRAENAEAAGRGSGLAKRLNAAVDDGVEAQKDYVTLQRLSALTGNMDPGTKTAILDEIRERTGIALDPNTDNVQAYKAAVNYLAPRMRVTGSGSSSDRDVQIFFRALPGLLGTPQGNQLAIQTLGGLAQNRIARGDIAQRWQRGELSAAQVDQLTKQLPDPFDAFRKATPGMNQPQAGELQRLTPQQAQKLPKGTRFMGVDGKVRIVQ